jgi:hypothetical protein
MHSELFILREAVAMGKSPVNRTDSIRDHIREAYIEPARHRGEHRIKVVAGDVHTGLGLRNRVPLVCSALRSKALLSAAGVRIVSDEGPPSGQSTTVAITYEILPDDGGTEKPRGGSDPRSRSSRYDAFQRLRGIAKKTFESLGGGEKFILKEREGFFGKGNE